MSFFFVFNHLFFLCLQLLAHGYSQKEVADYLGLHYSIISRLINEDNNISK